MVATAMSNPASKQIGGIFITLLVLISACTASESADSTTSESTTEATTATEAVPTTQASQLSPTEIGHAFIQARDAYDADTAEALFASDAEIHDDYMTSASEYHAHFAWHESADFEWRADQCSQTETGPPAEVTCTYTMENAWTKALGVDPISGGTFHFVISDGLIQEITHTFNVVSVSPIWNEFETWVRTNHPDDHQIMYLQGGNAANWTPKSVALFDRYTDEFVATVTTGTTP
jgi:hypothetical protein